MRFTFIALLLSAAPAAFGQAAQVAAGQLDQLPSPWTAPDCNFGKPPQQWDSLREPLRIIIETPPSKPAVLLGDASIDPQIVVHPSRRNLGATPPGTEVAQNLYPGLVFQRIAGQGKASPPAPLAITWPKLQIKEIPITWPNAKMEMINSANQNSSTGK